jgi:hypothetical protein
MDPAELTETRVTEMVSGDFGRPRVPVGKHPGRGE